MSTKKPILNSGQKTLTNYFLKTPKSEGTPKEKTNNKSPDENAFTTPTSSKFNKKRQRDLSDSESPIKPVIVNIEKRRRVITSSDEESNYMEVETPTNCSTPKSSMKQESQTPPSSTRSLAKSSKLMNQSFGAGLAESFLMSFRADSEADTSTNLDQSVNQKNNARISISNPFNDAEDDRFKHLGFDFLKPEKIRDAKKRRPDDPEYDPKTLYVPDDYLRTQTPSLYQWWQFKSQNFDTVLFFKTGKFYEFHHMDAVVASEVLNMNYMRDDKQQKGLKCGFPEISYGRFADQLVSRGYKVEQIETPDELAARNKADKSKEKVVRREICQITTLGTRTYGIMDGNDERTAITELGEASNMYLMAIAEKVNNDNGLSSYGVCFVDTSVGKFKLSQFLDDESRTFLRTLLAHNQPAQLLYEKNGISQATQVIFNTMLAAVNKEALKKEREFLAADKSLKELTQENYLGSNVQEWPNALRKMLTESVVPQAKPDYILPISCLGAILWYLQRCLIDVDMISLKDFEEYLPPSLVNHILKNQTEIKLKGADRWRGKQLVLDGITLQNLHVVPPLNLKKGIGIRDHTAIKGSLYSTINKCLTPFGKRLLRQWCCAPICDSQILRERQEAVRFLLNSDHSELKTRATETLRKLPDLERIVHTMGLPYRRVQEQKVYQSKESHPDSRANFFEETKFNKRKISDFVFVLNAFEQINKFVRSNKIDVTGSKLLDRCIGKKFPDITKELDHFLKSFDRNQALEDGKIIPKRGMDDEYDEADDAVRYHNDQLDEYLSEIKKKLRTSNIKYVNLNKDRNLLEVPDGISLDREFELKSKRKGFGRYTTDRLGPMVAALIDAEARRNAIAVDMTRRIFADFASSNTWAQVVSRITIFDCILSLTRYAETTGLEMCFPEIDFDSDQPYLSVKSGYHPSLVALLSSSDGSNTTFIPNDTYLGKSTPLTMLLTGPNMGGKSTLMRQVATLIILAQIGSMVPAKQMKFTPVDRIFSRIGANDRLMAGQSTFFVELNETNTILREATPDSLVVIDELGRGTSTFDGTAIASAVLSDIADRLKCRSFFSTHYHAICYMNHSSNVLMAHMACIVENENIDDPTSENVTFLYTLKEGICPKSYGFWCAIRSGIKKDVVRNAHEASRLFAQNSVSENKFSSKLRCIRESALNKETSIEDLQKLIAVL